MYFKFFGEHFETARGALVVLGALVGNYCSNCRFKLLVQFLDISLRYTGEIIKTDTTKLDLDYQLKVRWVSRQLQLKLPDKFKIKLIKTYIEQH